MIDDKGKNVKTAGPSVPVEDLGLSGVPQAGDTLTVVENEARARAVADYRQEQINRKRTTAAPTTFEQMFSALTDKVIGYQVVVKGDAQGSVGALASELEQACTY